MKTVKVQSAKTHLSALLAEVEAGEEIIIARGDRPVARPTNPLRPMGFIHYRVPEDFDDQLPEEELAAWEG